MIAGPIDSHVADQREQENHELRTRGCAAGRRLRGRTEAASRTGSRDFVAAVPEMCRSTPSARQAAPRCQRPAAPYRGQVRDAIPAGVTARAGDPARDTLGGAVGVADQLPAGLLAAARDAFTDGLHLAAVVAAVALAALAVTAAVVPRRVPAGSDPPTDAAHGEDGTAARVATPAFAEM